ncbi:hypothetical protein [Oceanobacillus neutriphilus]|uniref:Uncharacterized protein n=1 Tax=Oceanobacillus neutriphilus TaxID=531815 RepID=A0ABQ2NY82_9BACI|nr:hypothetical protein [Oceanobacillus neutriphilus]GGP13496.1 hypothetical protein GCM10011346_33720 [Oceanobacillus neutriphilus]
MVDIFLVIFGACAVICLVLLAASLIADSPRSKKSLKERLAEVEEENEQLKRKLHEGGTEVVVQFKTGDCITYEGVYYTIKGTEYVVLKDYDDKAIAIISRMELSHISSISAIKEATE